MSLGNHLNLLQFGKGWAAMLNRWTRLRRHENTKWLLMEEVPESPTWEPTGLNHFSVKPHSSLWLSLTWGKIFRHLFRERLYTL